jgi:hypothetical protein
VTFDGLAPGAYGIEELAISIDADGDTQADWELGDISCAGGDGTFTIADPSFVDSGLVTVDLAPGGDVVCTFTNQELVTLAPSALIGDRVWHDEDRDGIQDSGEADIPGVTVRLWRDPGGGADLVLVNTATTDASGLYNFVIGFEDFGDYVVEFVVPDGWAVSPADVGGDDLVDSDIGTDGLTAPIAVDGSFASFLGIDAGLYEKDPELPDTGADHRMLLVLALGLLQGGLLLLLVSRRPPKEA